MSGSLFFDLSNNANKLRKSYVNGFMDISGELLLRNDHKLGFYKEPVQRLPHYTMDSTGFKIYDITDAEGNFSTSSDITTDNLKQLSGVTTNIATDLSNLETSIETNLNTLQTSIDTNVNTLQGNIDANLNTLQASIDTNVNTLQGNIDTTAASIADLVNKQNALDLSFNTLPDPLNTSSGVSFASKLDVSGSVTIDSNTRLNSDVEIKNGFINQVL